VIGVAASVKESPLGRAVIVLARIFKRSSGSVWKWAARSRASKKTRGSTRIVENE
jgi:hypothetical protein